MQFLNNSTIFAEESVETQIKTIYMEQQAVIKTVGGQSPCKTCPHGEFLRIAKIVQVSAMKVHFQIAERSLFYLNPYIHLRRMTYPPERVRALGKRHHLNAKETNILHREVSHQGYGYWEIDELIYDLFGK